MKYRLLEMLRKQDGEWASWDALAADPLLSAAAVQGYVAELTHEGYRVEASPETGCRYLGRDDRLIPYEITRGLQSAVIGKRLVLLESTQSTNDDAWREALSGADEGTVVFAEEQISGRGRMGRRWVAAPRSSLLLSVVLRPDLPVRDSNLLTVMSSVAVAQTLREHLRLHARIKWPNDITIKDRKIAGILVESRSLATGSAFVLGIGLNVNTPAADFPSSIRDTATSLAAEMGSPLDRVEVARWLLGSLDRWYRDLRYGDYGRIARSWRRFSSSMGERITLLENGREFSGRVLDLSLEEGLIVRLDEGITRIFHPSTVSVRHQTQTKDNLHTAGG